MKHYYVEGKTLPEAYHKSLEILESQGNIYPCPDYNSSMKEVSLTFYVEDATEEPFVSKLFPGGHYELQQYEMEITDGVLDFMTRLGGNYWEYTYHQRFVYQLPFIYEEFRRNPYTRRATMNIRDFEVDSKNEHPACLQSIGLYQRNGKLHMKITMRSNDAVQATYMNACGFIALQKKIAQDLGYNVGSYTHTAYSFHAYKNSYNTLKSYVDSIKTKPMDELTYNYKEFYKELMQEAVPEIMEKIATLKREHKIDE